MILSRLLYATGKSSPKVKIIIDLHGKWANLMRREMTRKMVNVTRKSGPHHYVIAGAIMKSHHVIDGVLVIKDKKSLEGYLNF